MLVKCKYCGKEKEVIRGKEFCSNSCRVKAYRAGYLKTKLDEVRPLLEAGQTYREIAEKLGVTKQQVALYAKKLGYVRRKNQLRKAHKAYEGLKHKNNSYIRIYHNGKWMAEHRFIMEQYLGRPLQNNEVVHHINSCRSDNQISNLQLLSSNKSHMVKTAKCQGCLVIKENRKLQTRVRELELLLQPGLFDKTTNEI